MLNKCTVSTMMKLKLFRCMDERSFFSKSKCITLSYVSINSMWIGG